MQIALLETIHHKNTIVNTDTKDKGGDDNTDEVELHTEDVHDTQYNEPT